MFRWTLIPLCFTAHYDDKHIFCFCILKQKKSLLKYFLREMTAGERDQVIVGCNYFTTGTNINLFWYKQLPNRSPTFILGQYTTEPDFKKRFSATSNSTSRIFPLMIKDVRVSDSAVYYCALRPTVTETHSAVIQEQRNHIKPTIYNSHNIITLRALYAAQCSCHLSDRLHILLPAVFNSFQLFSVNVFRGMLQEH
uniref:Ig-like domain-containing protein n=1 Tax=Cyprinus carpio TaxID=7962 RepID=A0A8C2I612_CYPCA